MSKELIQEIKVQLALKDKSRRWLAKKLEISAPYAKDILDGTKPGKPQVEKMKKLLAELQAGMYDEKG